MASSSAGARLPLLRSSSLYPSLSLSLSVTGRENLFPKTSSSTSQPTNPLYDEKEYKGVQKVVNNRLL